jgi:hypothetical protein
MFYLKRWTAEEEEAFLRKRVERKKEDEKWFDDHRRKADPKAPPPGDGRPKVDYKKVARKANLTKRQQKVKVTLAAVPDVGRDE